MELDLVLDYNKVCQVPNFEKYGMLSIFLSYALFPLLLLLDAAVACRSPNHGDSEGRVETSKDPKTPHRVSDGVAEGVLQCLEELLIKCHLGSIEQVVYCETLCYLEIRYMYHGGNV